MTKVLTGLLAVAMVTVVVVGAMKTHAHAGMMPEVVSTAEMPRLVMPTVEVRAFQTVAVSASEYNAN